MPDRIDVYPLIPRSVDGRADPEWCEGQFVRGALRAKMNDESFVLLAQLKQLSASSLPEPAE